MEREELVIIDFFGHHGVGGSGPVLGYLTGYLVNGEERSQKPQVVRGDLASVAKLIDTIPFERKYTSGVCSWPAGELVTDAVREEIMTKFEDCAFAGLAPDRRSILWVRHTDKGREELHFVVPRCDLGTGKSLNIAPPTPASRRLFDTLRTVINVRYGFKDPGDPECRQAVSVPGHVAKLAAQAKRLGRSPKADIRQSITERIMDEVRTGTISNRAGVVNFLKKEGFTLTRAGVDYVTIACPESGKRVRLKGEIYRENFEPQDLERKPASFRQPGQLARLERQLEGLVEKRAAFHRARYPAIQDSMAKEPSHDDRTRDSLVGSRATNAAIVSRARTPTFEGHLRLNLAAQRFGDSILGYERAGERLGQAHREFARAFEAAVAQVSEASDAEALVRRYGLERPTREQEHELEMDFSL